MGAKSAQAELPSDPLVRYIRIIAALLILGVAAFVALSPRIVYAPTPRVILFFLVAFLPGILFGAEAATKFRLDLQQFCFATGGASALCLGTLILLNHLSKPAEQIAIYQIFDERGRAVPLGWEGALEVPPDRSGMRVNAYAVGNTLILVFPEQLGEATVRVQTESQGPVYSGTVGYAGNRTSELYLGKDLKPRPEMKLP